MAFCDYHTHTCFSDGHHTPEEMVRAAIAKGMPQIGFSDHSYTAFDESYCISKEKLGEYRQTIAELKQKYENQITILCGIEQDFYSQTPTNDYDYVIGSVHYVSAKGRYLAVDETPEILQSGVQELFDGDYYELAEAYFANVAEVAEKTDCDIIGHFDLVSKFNRENALFYERHPRYVQAWKQAADKLLTSGKCFEINTGAIARGYQTRPYPAPEMIDYIRTRGGVFLLSSDSHQIQNLCFDFEKQSKLFHVKQSII